MDWSLRRRLSRAPRRFYLHQIKGFDDLDTEPGLPNEQYKALKIGDKILVQLDGDEPAVKTFRSFASTTKREHLTTGSLKRKCHNLEIIR